MNEQIKDIRLVAIDADDTLWDCQSHFDHIEHQYSQLLSEYADEETVSAQLFQTEISNMPTLGFGTKAFTLSLIENATILSKGTISGDKVLRILEMGKSLLNFPTTPLPEVEDTLTNLQAKQRKKGYKVVVFTKGELQDQENKLRRSGLWEYFDDVIIVSDKTEAEYNKLCATFDVNPNQFVMIGNSFKSDIAPALAIGGYAIHIPYHVVWKMEHAETFDHKNLRSIQHFSELLNFL